MNLFRFFFSKSFWISLALALIFAFGFFYYTTKYIKTYTQHGVEVEVPNLSGKTLEEAILILKDKKLKSVIFDSANYNPKKKPLSIISHFPEEGENVKEGRLINLTINPSNYRKVKLPNLLNKTIQELEIYFKVLNLKIGKITYKTDIAKDIILEVSSKEKLLEAGEMVNKYTVIDLVVAKNNTDSGDKKIPNLIGLTYNQAQKALEDSLFFASIPHHKNTTSMDSARVIFQTPRAYSKMDIGKQVDVYLTDDTISKNIKKYIKEIKKELSFIQDDSLSSKKSTKNEFSIEKLTRDKN